MTGSHPRSFLSGPDPFVLHLLASRPDREGRAAAAATLASVAAHAALLGAMVWGTAAVGGESDDRRESPIIVLRIPEPSAPEPMPPLPEAPPVHAPAVQAAAPALPGFKTLPDIDVVPPDIPVPSAGPALREQDFAGVGAPGGTAGGDPVGADDLAAAPRFTPFSVAPVLLNRDAIERAMRDAYPALLRQAGIGGTVVVWIHVDADGSVIHAQVSRGSGRDALDAAAVDVARRMRFRPAKNMDRATPVWVELPVEFTAR